MKKLLVTGSSGLIGSEVCIYFGKLDWEIHGIDNNQRAVFFGQSGDTRWSQKRLQKEIRYFKHYELDIRDRDNIIRLISTIKPDAIVHTAAQPSHDKAALIPFDDFDTNAVGTFNLLEATRRYSTEIPFVHLSTNKVYGDAPNEIKMLELDTRWDYADKNYKEGIPETFRVDQCKHSLFGSSKLAADISVQEYGRYFGLKTACFRGGCLTGSAHSGTELHGFLSYLMMRTMQKKPYTVFGYKGKQVRDNIHSFDLVNALYHFYKKPGVAKIYNIGGSRYSNSSMLEAIKMCEDISGNTLSWNYEDENRFGDHIWWISDISRFKADYADWNYQYNMEKIMQEIYEGLRHRLNGR